MWKNFLDKTQKIEQRIGRFDDTIINFLRNPMFSKDTKAMWKNKP